MRGTSEEAMVTRRHTLRRKSEKLPAMEEDASLSKFLQNQTFLTPEEIDPADVPRISMSLIHGFDSTGCSMAAESSQIDVDTCTAPGEIVTPPAEPPLKKQKVVHFEI